MNYITEFMPDQLIIIQDYQDVPAGYQILLAEFLEKRYGLTTAAGGQSYESSDWDFGTEIRIIHWEWNFSGEWYLIVDICGYPGGDEHGICCLGDQIIFENNNKKLTPLVKSHPLLTRTKAFEYIRRLDGTDEHSQHTRSILDELKKDLEEESVDEEEFEGVVRGEYQHFSSDDASSIE